MKWCKIDTLLLHATKQEVSYGLSISDVSNNLERP